MKIALERHTKLQNPGNQKRNFEEEGCRRLEREKNGTKFDQEITDGLNKRVPNTGKYFSNMSFYSPEL